MPSDFRQDGSNVALGELGVVPYQISEKVGDHQVCSLLSEIILFPQVLEEDELPGIIKCDLSGRNAHVTCKQCRPIRTIEYHGCTYATYNVAEVKQVVVAAEDVFLIAKRINGTFWSVSVAAPSEAVKTILEHNLGVLWPKNALVRPRLLLPSL